MREPRALGRSPDADALAYIRFTMGSRSASPPARAGASDAWSAGPRVPSLSAQELHVWKAELSGADELDLTLLDTEERARMARFVHERYALRWGRCRCLLRVLLGRYLNADPAMIQIRAGGHGKPFVDDRATGRALHFNLSHSGELALYAFATDGAVGVDVQIMREPSRRARTDRAALAARVFGAEAAARLGTLPPESREREFLRLWTRHEAELKCRGTGIGAATAGDYAEAHAEPWIVELEVGGGAAAALAAERRPARELRRWEWTPRRS